MNPRTLTDTAHEVVSGDRNTDYGDPSENHQATADFWSVYLRRRLEATRDEGDCFEITVDDVCHMNILQKVSRLANSQTDDNDIDIVGYILNKHMIKELEEARKQIDWIV